LVLRNGWFLHHAQRSIPRLLPRVGGPGDYTDVHQLFYNGMNWSDQDLTTLAKSPQATEGPVAAFSIGNYQYVYYNRIVWRQPKIQMPTKT
jgi:hypothetical protein